MSPAQHHAQLTVSYLEEDLGSFEAVVATPALHGKLGVAMITTATAALDLFAWLFYQKFDLTVSNRDLFKKLTADQRFFAPGVFQNEKFLYGIIRCGVVHQFYPKGVGIVAIASDTIFVARAQSVFVNSLGFYRTVLAGLSKARDHVLDLSGDELARLDAKIEFRERLDQEALEGAQLDPNLLPQF